MTQHSTPATAPKPESWAYAENFGSESDAMRQAREAATTLGIDVIGRGTASALTLFARTVNAKNVVEIGTGTGVSGLALFAGMTPDGVLTSIDQETDQQNEAGKVFKAADIPTRRYRLINGRALDVLPNLRDGAYDIVLIDGDKLEYVEYVGEAMRLLRPGGLVIFNDALWHGGVADNENESDETVIIREALQAVLDDENLTAALLPVGDGLLVAVKA